MHFDQLIGALEAVHTEFSARAIRQINTTLTIRNWLIGYYLVTYEQNGEDRAAYGQQVVKNVAKRLKNVRGFASSNLFNFKQFYLTYPWFSNAVIDACRTTSIFQTVSGKLQTISTASQIGEDSLQLPAEQLLTGLTFSHFIELIRLDSELKRRFYEMEAVKNAWSVRELARATETLLFERTALSTDKASVINAIKENKPLTIDHIRKSPYILEFLGLEEKPTYSESDLEMAILNHLQAFLGELGRGFCFEARQRRITFGNTHYYIDLVFYHRILKCHILIDLKLGRFNHADAGQMNVYLNYYKANEMTDGDNAPIGLILCADQDDLLVEYATSGMSNEVFVSKYLVQLPDRETLLRFLRAELS